MAVAHSMLVAIYHVLKDGVKYEDLGAEYLILQVYLLDHIYGTVLCLLLVYCTSFR